jgi:hypothetical protein
MVALLRVPGARKHVRCCLPEQAHGPGRRARRAGREGAGCAPMLRVRALSRSLHDLADLRHAEPEAAARRSSRLPGPVAGRRGGRCPHGVHRDRSAASVVAPGVHGVAAPWAGRLRGCQSRGTAQPRSTKAFAASIISLGVVRPAQQHLVARARASSRGPARPARCLECAPRRRGSGGWGGSGTSGEDLACFLHSGNGLTSSSAHSPIGRTHHGMSRHVVAGPDDSSTPVTVRMERYCEEVRRVQDTRRPYVKLDRVWVGQTNPPC